MHDNSLLRTDKELTDMYQRNVKMVYKLCYIYLKNPSDAEDAVQSIFMKLISSQVVFKDREHEKAWLITASRNCCKNVLKNWWRTQRTDFESLPEIPSEDCDSETAGVLEKLLKLPEKYKTVLFMYYFEEYSIKEISKILGRRESTIQTQLARGREHLKSKLGGNYIAKKDCKSNI